jgi:hypothetical protein
MNLRSVYELESLEGYETIHPLRVSQFLAALNSGKAGTTPVGRYGSVDNNTSHLLDLSNTQYYLTHKVDLKNKPSPEGFIPTTFNKERFVLAFDDLSVAILESKSVLPRAFMVYDWEVIKEDGKIISSLLDENYPFENKIILESDPGLVSRDYSEKQTDNKVQYVNITEQSSEINVESEKEGILFVSEAWFPGWKAYVDDAQVDIMRADFMFRAIIIPEGEHNVRFIYDPYSFKIGLYISITTFFMLMVPFLYEKLRKKIGIRPP